MWKCACVLRIGRAYEFPVIEGRGREGTNSIDASRSRRRESIRIGVLGDPAGMPPGVTIAEKILDRFSKRRFKSQFGFFTIMSVMYLRNCFDR